MGNEIVEIQNSENFSDDSMDSEDETIGRRGLLLPRNPEYQQADPAEEYKQRLLILSSRGITHRFRHLMSDLNLLLPHSKKDSKFDQKSNLYILNEVADLHNCNNCMFFETRKHQDLYMWLSKTPNGPSVKFHLMNGTLTLRSNFLVHTMSELNLTGNALKGSRHVLSFDPSFDETPHNQLIKQILTHTFAVPKTSRKVKPFVDHVISFSLIDDKIWFRNYQIVETDDESPELVEIGPRFVMNPIRVFAGSFGGPTLYENPEFVSPNAMRAAAKQEKEGKYKNRFADKEERKETKKDIHNLPQDPTNEIFY